MLITDLLENNFKFVFIDLANYNFDFSDDFPVEYDNFLNQINYVKSNTNFENIYFRYDNYHFYKINQYLYNPSFINAIIKNLNSDLLLLIFSDYNDPTEIVYRRIQPTIQSLGYEKIWLLPLNVKTSDLIYYEYVDKYVVANRNIRPSVYMLEGKVLQTVTEIDSAAVSTVYGSPFIPTWGYVYNGSFYNVNKVADDQVAILHPIKGIITTELFRYMIIYATKRSTISLRFNLAFPEDITVPAQANLVQGINLIDLNNTIALAPITKLPNQVYPFSIGRFQVDFKSITFPSYELSIPKIATVFTGAKYGAWHGFFVVKTTRPFDISWGARDTNLAGDTKTKTLLNYSRGTFAEFPDDEAASSTTDHQLLFNVSIRNGSGAKFRPMGSRLKGIYGTYIIPYDRHEYTSFNDPLQDTVFIMNEYSPLLTIEQFDFQPNLEGRNQDIVNDDGNVFNPIIYGQQMGYYGEGFFEDANYAQSIPFAALNLGVNNIYKLRTEWAAKKTLNTAMDIRYAFGTSTGGNGEAALQYFDRIHNQVLLTKFLWGQSGAVPIVTATYNGVTKTLRPQSFVVVHVDNGTPQTFNTFAYKANISAVELASVPNLITNTLNNVTVATNWNQVASKNISNIFEFHYAFCNPTPVSYGYDAFWTNLNTASPPRFPVINFRFLPPPVVSVFNPGDWLDEIFRSDTTLFLRFRADYDRILLNVITASTKYANAPCAATNDNGNSHSVCLSCLQANTKIVRNDPAGTFPAGDPASRQVYCTFCKTIDENEIGLLSQYNLGPYNLGSGIKPAFKRALWATLKDTIYQFITNLPINFRFDVSAWDPITNKYAIVSRTLSNTTLTFLSGKRFVLDYETAFGLSTPYSSNLKMLAMRTNFEFLEPLAMIFMSSEAYPTINYQFIGQIAVYIELSNAIRLLKTDGPFNRIDLFSAQMGMVNLTNPREYEGLIHKSHGASFTLNRAIANGYRIYTPATNFTTPSVSSAVNSSFPVWSAPAYGKLEGKYTVCLTAQSFNSGLQSLTGFYWNSLLEHVKWRPVYYPYYAINQTQDDYLDYGNNPNYWLSIGQLGRVALKQIEVSTPTQVRSQSSPFMLVFIQLAIPHNLTVTNLFGLTATTDITVMTLLYQHLTPFMTCALPEIVSEFTPTYLKAGLRSNGFLTYKKFTMENFKENKYPSLCHALVKKDLYELSTDTQWTASEFSWYHTTNISKYIYGTIFPFSIYNETLISKPVFAQGQRVEVYIDPAALPAWFSENDFIARAFDEIDPGFVYTVNITAVNVFYLLYPSAGSIRFICLFNRTPNASFDTNMSNLIDLGNSILNDTTFDLPVYYRFIGPPIPPPPTPEPPPIDPPITPDPTPPPIVVEPPIDPIVITQPTPPPVVITPIVVVPTPPPVVIDPPPDVVITPPLTTPPPVTPIIIVPTPPIVVVPTPPPIIVIPPVTPPIVTVTPPDPIVIVVPPITPPPEPVPNPFVASLGISIRDPGQAISSIFLAKEYIVGNVTLTGQEIGYRPENAHWIMRPIKNKSLDFINYKPQTFVYSNSNQEWDKVVMTNANGVNLEMAYKYISGGRPANLEFYGYGKENLLECIAVENDGFSPKYAYDAFFKTVSCIKLNQLTFKNQSFNPVVGFSLKCWISAPFSLPINITSSTENFIIDVYFPNLREKANITVLSSATIVNNQHPVCYHNSHASATCYFISSNLECLTYLLVYSETDPSNYEFFIHTAE